MEKAKGINLTKKMARQMKINLHTPAWEIVFLQNAELCLSVGDQMMAKDTACLDGQKPGLIQYWFNSQPCFKGGSSAMWARILTVQKSYCFNWIIFHKMIMVY